MFGIVFYKKANFVLEQATKAQKVSRNIDILFLYPWCWMEWVINIIPRPIHTSKEIQYPFYRTLEAGWPSGPVWTVGN
jgi:hypothetical protein